MVFFAEMAIAVELIALVAGTLLLAYACKEGVGCKAFAKAIAYIVIVISILSLLFTGYYSLRYWEDGYYKSPQIMGGKHRGPGRKGPKGRKYLKEKRHRDAARETIQKQRSDQE